MELGLPLRRERKSTTQEDSKIKEDGADSKQITQPAHADMLINLVDFPQNQAELEAFVKLRNPINQIIVVREKKPENFEQLLEESHKPRVVSNEEDQPADEVVEEIKLIEDEERERIDNLIRAYDYKAFKGARNSILKLSD